MDLSAEHTTGDLAARAEIKPAPLVVAINMGYGHLRPAHALADVLGATVMEADREPLAPGLERRLWRRVRSVYELASRASQLDWLGLPWHRLLEAMTDIPHLHPDRDLSGATIPVRLLRALADRGLGRGLVAVLEKLRRPLVTTFYAPAVLADYHGYDNIVCVVTDVDVNRVWAPFVPARTRIRYCVPGPRTRRRLIAYGVPKERVHVTGFPLPESLLGGARLSAARKNLAGRLARLDPKGIFADQYRREVEHVLGVAMAHPERTPRLTFAVGGAGAQAHLARAFLPSLRRNLADRRLRLSLVAGVRRDVASAFEAAVLEAGLGDLHTDQGGGVEVLVADSFPEYLARFNVLLADTDILWTKPSELTFFAALGLPLVLTDPVGVHERYNRRWAVENGAAVPQHDPRFAGEWIDELLQDGTFAHAAWSGFTRLPNLGLYRIAEIAGSTGGVHERED